MTKVLHLLFADDDADDHYFFNMALKALSTPVRLTTVEDGEQLMKYLIKHSDALPDILFLDLNMPRKNGAQCLNEIKANEVLKRLPVIIYSTSVHGDMADLLYNAGAHYCVKKVVLKELETVLEHILTSVRESKFPRPARDRFIINTITPA